MTTIPSVPVKFTRDELCVAFEKVQDKKHWKNPIDTYCDVSDITILTEAIPYFTGTVAEFGTPNKYGKVRVKALGYYLGPCN